MWVMEKIRVSMESSHLPIPSAEFSFKIGDIMFRDKADKPKRISLCPNVITPNNIPEFCIPPSLPSLEPARAPRPEEGAAQQSWTLGPHIIQVESVDEGPCEGCSDEETTNADPQSQAALSLPHLAKTQTCYGFCTLLESPHTRRKESLFHNEPGASPLLLPRSRSGPCSRAPSSPPTSFSSPLSPRLSPRGCPLTWQPALESDTTSSAESSPFGSPLLGRAPAKCSLFKTLSHELLLSRNMRKALVSRNNSLSTDEGSSTDNSPNVMRRASEAPASGRSLAPPAVFPPELSLQPERSAKEKLVPLGRGGGLRLAAEHCPDNRRLRVRLIATQGLYPPSVDPKVISCSVSLCLSPGKVQKQRSTVIRKSRNPVFNEDFFFDGVSQEELGQRSLRFKVVNKMSSLKRDYLLGDCELPLSSIVT